jgi:exonuclease III
MEVSQQAKLETQQHSLLTNETKFNSHFSKVFDSHRAVILCGDINIIRTKGLL